jgi:hypothetical protein
MKKHLCPVCGWPALQEAPRSRSGGGSFEICPSCGFEFGVSDEDGGHTIGTWRADWVRRGQPWSSVGVKPPPGWDPAHQLRSVSPEK